LFGHGWPNRHSRPTYWNFLEKHKYLQVNPSFKIPAEFYFVISQINSDGPGTYMFAKLSNHIASSPQSLW